MPDTVPRRPRGLAARWSRTAYALLLSPWSRFGLLVAVLGCAAAAVAVYRPQQALGHGWPPHAGGITAVALFAVAYGLCAAAFAPRPLLTAAAGALLGPVAGLAAAVAGTVFAAAVAFGLGRLLGQGALRPLVRGRWLRAADGLMSRHGFRSMLAMRLFPGVPFAAANYAAAVSRMGWLAFLVATAVGTVPNTAAYAIAGSRASSPTSPAFLASTGFIVVSATVLAVVAWRKRHRLGAHADVQAGVQAGADGEAHIGGSAEDGADPER